jgi:hypothetical protein
MRLPWGAIQGRRICLRWRFSLSHGKNGSIVAGRWFDNLNPGWSWSWMALRMLSRCNIFPT